MADESFNLELTRDGERIPVKVDIAVFPEATRQFLENIVAEAEQAADKANLWANAPEDFEVEPGEFSAFHFARQAEDIAHAAHTIYLAKDGSDSNSGRAPGAAFFTFEAALTRLREMAEKAEFVTLKVYPGSYTEKGNLEVPANSAVVSESGQFVTELVAAPGYEQVNMFLLNSGSYVKGFSFRNMQVDNLDDPSVGFAYAFAPNAKIIRSPYCRDSSQLSNYTRENIVAPLDPANANPAVGNGGGMILADRSVINSNSPFPYMLAFGATPRTPNGIGYCAKNGAGINGISSLTIFARTSFFAINGGQITLNNSGTQFGDISMRAKGSMQVVRPARPEPTDLTADPSAATVLRDNRVRFIDNMWDWLVDTGRVTPWLSEGKRKKVAQRNAATNQKFEEASNKISQNIQRLENTVWDYLFNNYNAAHPDNPINWSDPQIETFTRRDTNWLITAVMRDLYFGIDNTCRGFVEGLYDLDGNPVFDEVFRLAFIDAWDVLLPEMRNLNTTNDNHFPMLNGLFDLIKDVVTNEPNRDETRVVIPADLETFHAPSMEAHDILYDNVDMTIAAPGRTNPLIEDMWTFILNNEEVECWSGIDWTINDREMFTKRDAQWFLSALARDFRHGNTQSSRRFVEGLFNRNGEFVFPEAMKCGFKLSFDYMVGELRPSMNDTDFEALINLVDLIKTTLDFPNFGFSDKEKFTRRDASNLINAIAFDVESGLSDSIVGLSLGLFDFQSNYVFDPSFILVFVDSWRYLESEFNATLDTENLPTSKATVTALMDAIVDTVQTPNRVQFSSLIESLGHQFNNAGAGVNTNALPLNFRRGGRNRTVPFTVVEENGGRVRWSGSDELNNQYLAGGTRINGQTGRIEGRPFNAAVRQIARRIANTRGSF